MLKKVLIGSVFINLLQCSLSHCSSFSDEKGVGGVHPAYTGAAPREFLLDDSAAPKGKRELLSGARLSSDSLESESKSTDMPVAKALVASSKHQPLIWEIGTEWEAQFWEEGTKWGRQPEFNKFFNKLRLRQFNLRNNTEGTMKGDAVAIDTAGITRYFRFSIYSGEEMEMDEMNRYLGIRVNAADIFLNAKLDGEEGVEISGDESEETIFPRKLEEFDFLPQLFNADSATDMVPFNPRAGFQPGPATEQFMRDFDGNLKYIIRAMCPGEKIDPLDIFDQRNRLYRANNPNSVLFSRAGAAEEDFRIPLDFSRIWFTSQRRPNELPDDYIDWMLSSAAIDPDGKTNLWILNKDDLPKTMEKLEGTSIKIKEIRKDLPEKMQLSSIFEEVAETNKFGQLSDIARMEILREGGVYEDTDYRRHQSMVPIARYYDLAVGLEPMSSFLGNAFIAASPGHPVVQEYLDQVERNYDPERVPSYINRIPKDDGFKTILLTGPGALTTAFYKAAGSPGKRDIAMPPMVFYPTPVNAYPQKDVVKPLGPVPIWSVGAHYWETSWMRFGSKG